MTSRRRLYLSAAVFLLGCAPGPEGVDPLAQAVLQTGQINGSGLPAKTVVLTYDDGPDDHTIELAQYLKDQGIRATFFVNGRRFCKSMDETGKCLTPQDTRRCTNGQMQAGVTNPKYYPEAWLDQLVAMGHRIANHTQDHCHLPGQSMEDLQWEVKTTQDLLDKHICDNVYLLRAPFGEWNASVVTKVNAMMGFTKIIGPINWDVDGNDWDCWQKGTSPDACANKYMSILNGRGSQNGIFLMHDRPEFNVGYEGPLLMTKILVPRLKAAGFKFATMDEVLKKPPSPIGCPMSPAADAGSTPTPDAGSAVADAEPIAPTPDASGGTPADAAATVPADARAATGGSSGGTGTGGASGGKSGGSEETGGDEGGGGPTTSTGKSGGCAVGGSGAGSAWILALGLLALLRRRR
jgi:peptidoglycan/xylan/chitin deacetylase (PgdA/CDA1 family)